MNRAVKINCSKFLQFELEQELLHVSRQRKKYLFLSLSKKEICAGGGNARGY